jgi:hypothetical protein
MTEPAPQIALSCEIDIDVAWNLKRFEIRPSKPSIMLRGDMPT